MLTTTALGADRGHPFGRSNYERLKRAADVDRYGRHHLTESVEEADLVIFVGSESKYHSDVKRSELVRRHSGKCFLYDEQDRVIPSLPGVYMGLDTKTAARSWYKTGFFLRVMENGLINFDPDESSCRYLFSFCGRADNSPVRRSVISLKHGRAFLADSNSGQSDGDSDYAGILQASKFVLCPRGRGPSTWRLFETMKAGRVPVILSDAWIPPPGPPWHDFSVRLAERDSRWVPKVLEELECKACEMGREARRVWEQWFSQESAFHTIVEWCLSIKFATAGSRYFMPSALMPIRTLHPYHFKQYWRDYIGQLARRIQSGRGG